jgi:hypothetical protein
LACGFEFARAGGRSILQTTQQLKMQMTKLLVAVIFAAVFSVYAETQPRGADRLRELVVFPQINFNFGWGINCQNNEWQSVKTWICRTQSPNSGWN